MSLGRVLGIDLDNCAREAKYLEVADYIDTPPLPERQPHSKKIGIAWRGSPTHSNDKHRSCPLEQLIEITEQPDCEFYALNIDISKAERKLLQQHKVHILEHNLTSFAKTAVYIEQLDLVISVDTSIAHLAGGLNIPVWLLLSQAVDWRWQLTGESTPWYPNMRLRRQTRLDDWRDLLQQVNSELGQI
jgi:ADP-heptose:LPS heptosyltransferase